ncbi:DUF808 domain-containing protein [Brevibacterium sp. UMB1308A]|uniref:DUF808 domain-containing protein n=1 Tax=Brevibacterium sp. UMB1308A TaxID=3050608 RepID=UPI00254DEF4D|nr:DUF808 domain-containing protein [Brevibacterium sp. UMB1308A]MDK8345658.1 DUF808 domain-containing protein [Brevibacterium sp. UMB1308B]MDK8713260.1 DUF808 domain-containing protein [Brevibacterium sp. UMB1308A]
MSGGLVALLDDIAAIARMAAASVDDVAVGAAKTSAKAAGVVVDDAAVTPQYVSGVEPARELPIIRKIATGSIVNKLVIILPLALLLSAFAPFLLTPLLMIGGTYLCFEGAEKIWHKLTHRTGHDDNSTQEESNQEKQDEHPVRADAAEKQLVRSAIVTDFILSTEIMVISLNEVISEPLLMRTAILIAVALFITIAVYGVVGLIVKMDDIGLRLAQKPATQKLGTFLVNAMPKLLSTLTIVGVFAMLWVGGHILLVGADELGLHLPLHIAHAVGHIFIDIPVVGGVLNWLGETVVAMVVGLVWGLLVIAVVAAVKATARTFRPQS